MTECVLLPFFILIKSCLVLRKRGARQPWGIQKTCWIFNARALWWWSSKFMTFVSPNVRTSPSPVLTKVQKNIPVELRADGLISWDEFNVYSLLIVEKLSESSLQYFSFAMFFKCASVRKDFSILCLTVVCINKMKWKTTFRGICRLWGAFCFSQHESYIEGFRRTEDIWSLWNV